MSDASLALYKSGSLAFKQARYSEAIDCLERFCRETVNRRSKQFFQAQMWLIQAYHEDHQNSHAIALCEQLTKSEISQVKQWADRALKKLNKSTSSPDTSASGSSKATPSSALPSHTDQPADTSVYTISAIPEGRRATPKATPTKTTSDKAIPRRTAATGHATSRASTRRVASNHSRQHSTRGKDRTNQVMSAIAHGSISALASISLFILFSDSFAANILGVARYAVPLLIFSQTNDQITKANAKEALNYIVTCLLLLIPFILSAILLPLIFLAFWPVGVLFSLILGGYLLILSIYPVVATILCLVQEDKVVCYPKWLILHLV